MRGHLPERIDDRSRHSFCHALERFAQVLSVEYHRLEGAAKSCREVFDDVVCQLVECCQRLFGAGKPLLPIAAFTALAIACKLFCLCDQRIEVFLRLEYSAVVRVLIDRARLAKFIQLAEFDRQLFSGGACRVVDAGAFLHHAIVLFLIFRHRGCA